MKETLVGYLLGIIIIHSVSHLYGKDQEEVIQFNIIIMHLSHAYLSFMVQNLMLSFVHPESETPNILGQKPIFEKFIGIVETG